MVENLKTTKYRNGMSIDPGSDTNSWVSSKVYCWYNNNSSNKNTYGALYSGNLMYDSYMNSDVRELAPEGWHIPTYDEWSTLITNLAGSPAAISKLKAGGSSGFNARLSGSRNNNSPYGFSGLGVEEYWWMNTPGAVGSWMACNLTGSNINYTGGYGLNYGFSVRCIRNW
jgi:uncharacterized protein (TIGR02145 family)